MNNLFPKLKKRTRLEWQIGTVKAIRRETPTVKTFTLSLPNFAPHRAGQHYDVRLTAEDGYQAQRSYSIASEPERTDEIDLTVERLDDGEVSSYMHDVLIVGDRVELRGPIGGYFVWESSTTGPLILIGGGSGVVPLMSMIRHRARSGMTVPTRLLYSVRSPDEVIYADELKYLASLKTGFELILTYTRQQPPGWKGYARRIDRAILNEAAGPVSPSTDLFVCGPTLMVEAAANTLVGLGFSGFQIRTERFGSTT
jgi:ferredoxin-NADP reductase